MSNPEALIHELNHNATASGNQTLERRLADLTVWFYKNKDSIARDNLAARQAFLEKSFWIMLEVNALLLERIREEKSSKALWLPKGVRLNGDVRQFG